ncbi:MAG: tripartite tricarboxylate transporter substrate binding protein [Bacillota bacterium]
MRYRLWSVVSALVLLTLVVTSGCGNLSLGGYPKKAVEFVVPFGAGGGSDILGRSIASVFEAEQIFKKPLTVVNKAGGSGAVGYAFIAEKKGDPYYLGTVSSSFWTTPLINKSDLNYTKFTMVAGLAYDGYVLLVKKDSKLKEPKDMVAALKAKAKSVSIGGTGMTSDDRVVTYLWEKEAGILFNYVPFNSGGEVMTNLLGGHIDAAWANPGEALGQIQSGDAVPIAVASPNRFAGLKDVPTMKELGFNTVSFLQLRGVLAPAEIPDSALKALEAGFKKMSESPKWTKDYVEKNMIVGTFMDSKTFTEAVAKQNELYKAALTELGVIK